MLPNVINRIIDPGLGLVQDRNAGTTWIGPCSSGTVNQLYNFNSLVAAQQTLGQGPLAESVAHTLAIAGGPVNAIRVASSVGGAAGTVTKTAADSSTGSIAASGTPSDGYRVTVEVTKTGTNGAAEFRYRLDKASTDLSGGTWSSNLIVPSGGAYAIPGTGLTLTFTPGAGAVFFEDGDLFVFTCSAPYFGVNDLAGAMPAVRKLGRYGLLAIAGQPGDASDGVAMFAALGTHLTALQQEHQYFRGFLNAGNDTNQSIKDAFSAVADKRIVVALGDVQMASSVPSGGNSLPWQPTVLRVVSKTSQVTVSDDPARYPSGPETGVIDVSHDERLASVTVDDPPYSISAMRSFPGEAGYYLNNVRLRSPAGSDYEFIQHGRVMDLACATSYGALLPFLNTSVRILKTGAIDPRDKARIEGVVNDALKAKLLEGEKNLDGNYHASDARFVIDGTYNIAANKKLQACTKVRPLGYLKEIQNDIGYSLQIGGDA